MVLRHRLECYPPEEDPCALQANSEVITNIKKIEFSLIFQFFFKKRAPNDTSNFSSYPESDHLSPALKPSEDPFLDW